MAVHNISYADANAPDEVSAKIKTVDAQVQQGYQDAVTLLEIYLMAMAIYQIVMTKNESKIAGLQSQGGDTISKQAQAELIHAKAVADENIEKIKEYQEEASKNKFLTIFMSVLGCVAAALSGGTLATVIAVSLTIFMNCGGAEKLNDLTQKLGCTDAFFAKLAICVAAAVILGAAAGAASTYLGAQTAGEAAAGAAEDGAESAASSGTKQGLGTAIASNSLSSFGLIAMMINPFTDMVSAIAKAANASDEVQELVSQIVGAIIAAIVGGVCCMGAGNLEGEATGTPGSKIANSMSSAIGPKNFEKFKQMMYLASETLDFASSGFRIASGVYSVKQFETLKDMAQLEAETGAAQGILGYFTELSTQQNMVVTRQAGHYDSLTKSFQMVNRNSDQLAAPWVAAAQIQV